MPTKKISHEELKKIIYEEVIKELAPCKDDKGKIASCEKGRIYSLTQRNKGKVKDCYLKRGIYQGEDKEGCPKVTTRFGVNTSKKKSAGRYTIQGEPISPKYRVKGYNQRYYPPKDKSLTEKNKRELDDIFAGYEELSSLANGIMEDAENQITLDLEKYLMLRNAYEYLYNNHYKVGKEEILENDRKDTLKEKCKDTRCYQIGYSVGQQEYVRAINAQALAQKGELFKKDK
jgi:hypothetical protein